jgi:hypothetical protein
MVVIKIENRSRDWSPIERRDDFRAYIKGQFLIYGTGRTALEAVGDLVYHNKEKFGIEIEV